VRLFVFFIGNHSSSYTIKDPDLENAPVVPEMGTIELQAFRCRAMGWVRHQPRSIDGLHQGCVSERSKKAGWHHVRYYIPEAPIRFSDRRWLTVRCSTADEIPIEASDAVIPEYVDPQDAPYAIFKVFYRPRGRSFIPTCHLVANIYCQNC